MILGAKLKQAIEESEYSTEEIADRIEMSAANLYKIYKKDSFEIKYLVQIAEILKLPIGYFLNDETVGAIFQSGIGNAGGNISNQKIMPQENAGTNKAVYDEATSNVHHLLELCKEQKASLEKEIALKDEIIELLKGKK